MVEPGKWLQRALNLLYPIECPEDLDTLSQDQGNTISQEKSVVTDNNAESVLDDKDAESGVDVEDHDNSNGESQTGDNLIPATRQPVRQATLAARQKLKRWLNPSENFTALGSVAIFLLRHGDSFILPFIIFFSIDWNA